MNVQTTMRRTALLLVLLTLTTAAFAGDPWNESNPRTPGQRFEGLQHMIVHVTGTLTEADRDELAAKGLFIQRALTRGRYLARAAEGRIAADPRVTSVEPIASEKKIASSAYREARSGRTWAELNVFFHEDVSFDDARQALLQAGAAIDPLLLEYTRPNRITVKIAPHALTALAGDDRVLGVTGPIRFKVRDDNAKSAALSNVDDVQAAPYGLTGAGVTVSLFELAPAQADHPEFEGRLTVQPSVTGGSNGNKGHATHVAGTIGAAGLNPAAKGMAPKVKIFQFCVRSGSNTCRNDFVKDKDEELPKLGVRADNNSWGYVLGWDSSDFWVWYDSEEFWGAYELELVSPLDAMSLDRNILFVHSAGNDGSTPVLPEWGQHRHVDNELKVIRDKVFCYSPAGTGQDCPAATCTGGCETVRHHTESPYDTIGLTASGKNTIAVGAVQQLNENFDIAGFSSRGPAKDGRVKPDVVARGYSVLSTVPTNSYGPSQGTSMAAPVVTGIAALLAEQHRKTFGVDPNPVQLKALMVAGADDVGRPGPDYTFGFGLVNAKASADLIINDQGTGRRIRNFTVAHTSTTEFPLVVDSPQNLKVVLQWGDPSIPLLLGEVIADKALVNDLDLKVIGPDGAEHRAWVLDKTRFEANATTGTNTVDNTEIVEVKNAPAGVWRAVVSGTNVPEGPQQAVLVTSVRAVSPCIDVTENRNENASAPYGDLTTGQTIFAGLCSQTDVDHFRFFANPGAASITFVTGDTPLKVTLSGGFNTSVIIPANTTFTITGTIGGSAPAHVNMKVEASGTVGVEPQYSFTPQFEAPSGPRRRSVRK